MLFGYTGGLVAMAVLGLVWRVFIEIARIPDQNADSAHVWPVLYLVALQTLLTVEIGFVLPYSVLIRFLLVHGQSCSFRFNRQLSRRPAPIRATVVGGTSPTGREQSVTRTLATGH